MKHLYVAAELIETAGLGVSGVDLFVGTLPADVHKGVELRDPLFGADLDQALAGFVNHQFQVIVRDTDPQAAFDKAAAISTALHLPQGLTRDGIYIRSMYPLQTPVTYPKGDSDEMETSVRIRCWFALT